MLPIRRILFPTDFSEHAQYAWSYALTFAQEFGAEVHLLHVVAPPPRLTETYAVNFDPEKMVKSLTAEANAAMDQQVEAAKGRGLIFHREVRVGMDFREIIEYATKHEIDLIVMATHGRTGLAHALLGSVAEAVVRAAPVPVLLLRGRTLAVRQEAGVPATPRPRPAELAAPSIHHTLCPVDFSETSERAMEYAGDLAQRFGADLTVLHVVYDPLDITCSHIPHPPLEQLREEMVREAEHTLHGQVHRALRFLPRAKTAVVAGPPFRQIIRYAREHHVDLIVMGTQGLRGLDHLIMGSTAERVVRTAPCPVVSIRAAA